MIRISTEFGRIPTKSFENLSSSSQAEPSMKQATSCGWLRYFGSIWGGSEESVDRMRMCPLDSGWRQTDMRTNPSCEMDSVLGNHWWNACNATVGYTWHLAGFTGIFGWIHSNPLMRHKSLLLFLYWQRWCRCQRRWSPCWRGAPFLREWIHCRMWPLLQFLKWLRHLSKKNKQKKQTILIHCNRPLFKKSTGIHGISYGIPPRNQMDHLCRGRSSSTAGRAEEVWQRWRWRKSCGAPRTAAVEDDPAGSLPPAARSPLRSEHQNGFFISSIFHLQYQ